MGIEHLLRFRGLKPFCELSAEEKKEVFSDLALTEKECGQKFENLNWVEKCWWEKNGGRWEASTSDIDVSVSLALY